MNSISIVFSFQFSGPQISASGVLVQMNFFRASTSALSRGVRFVDWASNVPAVIDLNTDVSTKPKSV